MIFGGYSSGKFPVDDFASDSGAFIFSLTKKTKHVQYEEKEYALYSNKDYLFGFGYDIMISD
jgi:hypothetical protein